MKISGLNLPPQIGSLRPELNAATGHADAGIHDLKDW